MLFQYKKINILFKPKIFVAVDAAYSFGATLVHVLLNLTLLETIIAFAAVEINHFLNDQPNYLNQSNFKSKIDNTCIYIFVILNGENLMLIIQKNYVYKHFHVYILNFNLTRSRFKRTFAYILCCCLSDFYLII